MCTWRACAYGLAGQTSPCVLQYKGGLYLGCTLLTSQIGRYNPSYNPLPLQPPLLQPLEGCYNQLCCNNLRYKGCKLPVREILTIQAARLLYAGEADTALSVSDRALRETPTSAGAWAAHALVLNARGEVDEAADAQ